MSATTTRTIDDLPRFKVLAVWQIESSAHNGPEYELSGTVDQIADIKEGDCYLLVRGEVLIAVKGNLRLLDRDAATAVFYTSETSMPEVVGLSLVYLDSMHDPCHVWMVAEPTWKWTKEVFQAVDAVFRRIENDKASMIDGEEVKEWIEIKPIGEGHLSRYYPVFPGARTTLPPLGPDGLIKAGWNHAHCELCNAHIDAGKYGYVDIGWHWVCEQCYAEYVVNHDLSFLRK